MDEQKLIKRKRKAKIDGNQMNLLSVCTDLAELYREQEKFQLAINEYITIADICKKENKLINYAQANRGIGEAYMGLGQFQKALEHQRIYLEVARKENNKLEEQRALATIGHIYLTWYLEFINEPNKNYLNSAYKYFMKSLMICENLTGVSKLEVVDMSARLLANLGVVQECLCNYDKALELLNKSINICKQNDIYEQLYRGYLSVASLYEKKGDYNNTIRNFNFAIDTAKKLRDKMDLICAALLAKSEVLNKLGDFHGSKQVLLKAYKLKSPNLKEREIIEQNLRIVAAMCITEDKLVVSTGDQGELKKLYEKMGDAACELKVYGKAIEYYEKMVEAAERSGASLKELASAYYSLAETYKDNGQFTEAVKYFEKEYTLCENNLADNLNTLSQIADTLEADKAQPEKVADVYERAFQNCKENSNVKEEKRMINRYITYLRRNNLHSEAFKLKHRLSELAKQTDKIDDESSSSDSEEIKFKIGSDICLSDLTDMSEESDGGCQLQNSDSLSNRRRNRQFAIKKNMKGETQLHTACISGSMPVVRHLIEQGHPINVRDNCGWLPLHEACICGHIEIVRLLLDKGASINDRGGTLCNGVTPIHDAASNGHLEIMEMLLDRGASAIVKTDDGLTPLHTLMDWYKRSQPEGQQLELYNKLHQRLTDILEKAGQHVKPVFSNIDQSPVHVLNKENIQYSLQENKQSSPQENIARLRRKIDEFDDFDSPNSNCTESLESGLEANEYREVMNTLRHKRNSIDVVHSRPRNNLTKRSAFVNAEDETDNWLEDDLKIIKKRRTNSFENVFSKFSQTNSTNSAIQKKTLAKSKSFVDENKIVDNFLEYEFDDDEMAVEDNRRSSTSSRCSSGSKSNKKKYQTSLLDAGFSRSRSTTPPSVKTNLQKNKQSTKSPTENFNSIEPASTSPKLQGNTQSISVDHTLFVDVKIEGRFYRVPVLLSQIQTHTIKWLAEEAANRYARKEYMKPSLELETKNGAILADDDRLNLLFPLGSMQAEPVEARVLKWDLPSLSNRYKEACDQMQCVNNVLCKIVEEMTITLNLSNRGLQGEFLAPLCKAVSHETSLLELDLSGNFLTNDCIKLLCSSLPTLENLYRLNLSCTGLQASHLLLLENVFVSNGPMKLNELNLSDNFLRDESIQHISEILKHLKICKLNLSNVNFTSGLANKHFQINLSHLEDLNLSDNSLDSNSIAKFLSATVPKKLTTLNFSRNGNSTNILKIVTDIFKNESEENCSLKTLDLSRCNVEDSEVFELLRIGSTSLQNINFSYNKNLTGLTLRRLLEVPTLHEINLLACDNIFKYFDFNLYYKILWKSDQNIKWSVKLSVNWDVNGIAGDAFIKIVEQNFPGELSIEKLPDLLIITKNSSNA